MYTCSFSKTHIKLVACDGATLVPMAVPMEVMLTIEINVVPCKD